MGMLITCRDICPPVLPCILPTPWPPSGGATPIDPTILALTCPTIPSTAYINTPTTIRVLGQNFTGTCVAFLDNVAQATSFVSTTELTFTATSTVAKTSTITVKDGATSAQGTCQFTWKVVPILTVICPLVPIEAIVGTAALQVTVNGTLFTNTCEVLLDGAPQPTTYISASQLRFTVNPVPETPRIATVGVRETATGVQAVTTCPFEFLPVVLVPIITSMVPDYVGDLDPQKTLTITGSNFDAASVVVHDVTDYPTTFVNATTLTVQTKAPPTATHSAEIRVRNGTALSTGFVLFNCVSNPVVNEIRPTSVPIGGADAVIELVGANFGDTVKVLMDGAVVPTTRLSGGHLSFTVRPSLEPAPRTAQITVRLGHDPVHIDNVLPVPMKSLPLAFT